MTDTRFFLVTSTRLEWTRDQMNEPVTCEELVQSDEFAHFISRCNAHECTSKTSQRVRFTLTTEMKPKTRCNVVSTTWTVNDLTLSILN